MCSPPPYLHFCEGGQGGTGVIKYHGSKAKEYVCSMSSNVLLQQPQQMFPPGNVMRCVLLREINVPRRWRRCGGSGGAEGGGGSPWTMTEKFLLWLPAMCWRSRRRWRSRHRGPTARARPRHRGRAARPPHRGPSARPPHRGPAAQCLTTSTVPLYKHCVGVAKYCQCYYHCQYK